VLNSFNLVYLPLLHFLPCFSCHFSGASFELHDGFLIKINNDFLIRNNDYCVALSIMLSFKALSHRWTLWQRCTSCYT